MFTTSFFLIYLIIVMTLFFCIRREWRISFLACASILFCVYLDVYASIVLLLLSLLTFIGGHAIEKMQKRNWMRAAKSLTFILIFFDSVLIITYKFGAYFFENVGYFEKMNLSLMEYLILPVGLSFYTFQSICYLADIYKKKYTPKENLMEFMMYMSFFPKLVSGPIERAGDFINQLGKIKDINFWQSGRLSVAFTYMLYGYFMKIVIADRVAVPVNRLFEYPQGYDSLWLLLGIMLYTVQIYADFAGYSYIAYGVAKIFGIELQLNFKNPYNAAGISEFWRKWHISLSSWLRDYIYIPLGGNRKGRIRKNINTMFVFIVCGLWHGTGLSFLIWGVLHGIYSVMENLFINKIRNRFFKRVITLIEISVAWVFFRATSVSGAINYFGQMVIQGTNLERIRANFWKLDLSYAELCITIFSISLMIWADRWADKQNGVFPEVLQKKPQIVRYCLFYLFLIIVFIFGIYGSGYHSENFIYMQF